MGRRESLGIEEIKLICEETMKRSTDKQIQAALEKRYGYRDMRTIRSVARVFWASKEVIIEDLSKTGRLVQGKLSEDINRVIDIVDHMSKGLRPTYYDKETGKVEYETWLEF